MTLDNFKIGHLSDIHLGYSSGKKTTKEGVNLRVIDGYRAYSEAISGMIEEGVDICVISGDMFHIARPDTRTVIEAQRGLRRLAEAGIPTYCIAGNHDATDIRAEIPASGILDDPRANIHSYTAPYVVKEVAPGLVMHFVSHHAFTSQEETMNTISLEDGKINVLVTHGSCFDTNMNIILSCPQEPREVVIPEFVMDLPWDYTLLGHIHERGWVGSEDGLTDTQGRRQFYGGSLIRRGFSDRECKLGRGWTLWTVSGDDFTPAFFNVNQRNQVDLPEINAGTLTPTEVEEALISQLEELIEKYSEDGVISDENAPIVRQSVLGLNPVSYASINWASLSELHKHFFTYTLKRVEASPLASKETDEAQANPSEEIAKTKKNVVEAFSSWVATDEIKESITENKEAVIDKTKSLLIKGQDRVLEND